MARLKTVRSKKLPSTSRAASSSQALAPLATLQLPASRSFYGVGAGDTAAAGDSVGEGLAGLCIEPPLVLWCLWVRDGVGVGRAAAAVVVVAFVPCCWQEEAINAMPMTAPIKPNMYLFIRL
jgi:hypothetical protein